VDVDAWLAFIEARNLISHVYKEAVATRVFQSAQAFPPFVDQLIARLQSVK
jgi:hypothetical protein